MAKVGVLGAGSWGTALAILLHDNGHDVTVWSIDPKEDVEREAGACIKTSGCPYFRRNYDHK